MIMNSIIDVLKDCLKCSKNINLPSCSFFSNIRQVTKMTEHFPDIYLEEMGLNAKSGIFMNKTAC